LISALMPMQTLFTLLSTVWAILFSFCPSQSLMLPASQVEVMLNNKWTLHRSSLEKLIYLASHTDLETLHAAIKNCTPESSSTETIEREIVAQEDLLHQIHSQLAQTVDPFTPSKLIDIVTVIVRKPVLFQKHQSPQTCFC